MRHPFRFRELLAVAAAVAALAVGAARARADEVPSDWREKPCTAPGQPCSFAGPEEDQEGTCAAATCTKQVRNHRDGVMTPVAFPCFECRNGGAGKSTSPPRSTSSGCAVAPERGDTGSRALAESMLVLAGLILGRRARRILR